MSDFQERPSQNADALDPGGYSTAQGTGGAFGETSSDTSVTQQATEAVTNTVQSVADTVSSQVEQVTTAAADRVEQVTNAAADRVEQLSDTVAQTIVDGDAPRVQRQVAETTVNVLDRTAEYLRTGDVDLMLEDLRDVVRQHPLRSLAIGLGLGYLARGRFFPATGAQGQSPARPRPPAVPDYSSPRSIPVYADQTTGYDTTLGGTVPPMDIAPLSGAGLSSTTLTGDRVGDAIMTDTDAARAGGAFDTGTSLDATELSSAALLDTDTMAGADVATGMAGSTTAGDLLGTGFADDTSASLSDLDATLGDTSGISGNAIGYQGMHADLTSDTGDLGGGMGEGLGAVDDQHFGVDEEGSATGEPGATTMPSDDVLQQWDKTTRKRKR